MPELSFGAQTHTYAGLTLDRAAEHRDDASWLLTHERAPESRFLWLDGDLRLAVDAASGKPYRLDHEARERHFADVPASLLGEGGGHTWFLLHAAGRMPFSGTVAWLGLRDAGMRLDAFDAGLFAYARGLAHWQSITRYCRTCGTALAYVSAGHRAQCTNPDCGAMQFPRTDAAIIVIVEHDGACLLGRQAMWPQGRYSTLAGFVEPGETLENAVRREVAEEAGVEIATCDYHSSQPWPFPASLMLGFTARASSRAITLRDGELEDARWFTPREIVQGVEDGSLLLSSPVSVSWHLLADWMRSRAGIDLTTLR